MYDLINSNPSLLFAVPLLIVQLLFIIFASQAQTQGMHTLARVNRGAAFTCTLCIIAVCFIYYPVH